MRSPGSSGRSAHVVVLRIDSRFHVVPLTRHRRRLFAYRTRTLRMKLSFFWEEPKSLIIIAKVWCFSYAGQVTPHMA